MSIKDRLEKIEYQLLKNLPFTPTDEQKVSMTHSILYAQLGIAADRGEDLTAASMPTSFFGASITWDPTDLENNKYTITLGSFTLTQDADVGFEPLQPGGGEAGGTEFITTWQTDATGTITSGTNQVKLPLQDGGIYNFTVDWGDGTTDTITSYNQAETTHTYSTIGSYDITIDGQCEGWGFQGTGEDNSKLAGIKQWGNVKLHNFTRQFIFCNLNSYTAIDVLDTSNITSMNNMFNGAILPSGFDISGWNTSSVTDMNHMFYDATLPDPFDLSGWNVTLIATEPTSFGTFNGTTQLKPIWGTNGGV